MNVLKLNTVYTVYINLTHFYIQSHAPAPPPWHSQKKDLNFESIKLKKNPNWFTIHIILLEMKIFFLSGITQTFIQWENILLLLCMLSTFDVNIPNGSMRENIRKNGCWVWKWFWLSCCFVHCLVSMYVIMWMIWGKYVCLLCCWWWWWWMTVECGCRKPYWCRFLLTAEMLLSVYVYVYI